jgi:predicted nucleotidyltransferase
MNRDGSLRAGVRAAITALDRTAPGHAAAMSIVAGMNRLSVGSLKAHPGIRDVYFRGSIVRGKFTPLASDIDLVLVLDEAAGSSYEGMRAVHRRLQIARRWNICIRDWWQHLILEAEMPLVEAYWAVYGAEEWRDADGRWPIHGDVPVERRWLQFATWVQLCSWSGSVFHAWFHPGDRRHSFNAGARKVALYSGRLERLMEEGPAHLDRETVFAMKVEHASRFAADYRAPAMEHRARCATLVSVYRAMESRAAALVAAGSGRDGVEPPGNTATVQSLFQGRERIIASEAARYIVMPDGLNDSELMTTFDRLTGSEPGDRLVTFVLPAAALQLFPFPAGDLHLVGEPGAFHAPAVFAPDLYRFDTLFLPSWMRLAVNFPDAGRRLRRVLFALLRATLLYGAGTFASNLSELRESIATPRLASVLGPGLEAVLDDQRGASLGASALFDLCSGLTSRLRSALLASSGPASVGTP